MAGPKARTKRPRMDESRDEELYLPDGNVVLSANDSEDNLIFFKVHQSMLSKHSTVFADMFSLPESSVNASEVYDGAPLVHLQDDAKDLKQFLSVIYDPW